MGERIAVVLCTRNGGRFLDEQSRSILAQDRPPDSLHLTDDASDDDTVAVARHTLEGAPFDVDIVTNDLVSGIAANFALTLQRTDSDVIALCDQDDLWVPAKLARIEETFADPRVTAVFSDGTLIDAAGVTLDRSLWQATGVGPLARRRVSRAKVFEQLLRWNVVTGATLAVRRDVLEVALPFPAQTLHDEWLALIAAGLGRVIALPQKLVAHRLHADAAVGVPPRHPLRLVRTRMTDDGIRDHEAARYDEAARRLRAAGRAEAADAAADKARFARRRNETGSPGRRAVVVVAGLATGRYHRLAHGFRSAAHDLAFGP